MTRTAFNFLIDTLLLILILSLAATGLLLRYVLPPGSRGGSGLSLWGWTRHDWGDLHFWIAIALAALLVLHVALHWSWVCATVEHWLGRKSVSGARSARRRNALGVAFALVLAAMASGFLTLAWTAREGAPGGRSGSGWQAREESGEERGRHDFGTGQVRGSMTLAELERASGVPADVIKQELGLPTSIPSTERLSELKRRYGFEMSTVRRIVNRHQAERSPAAGE